MEKKEKKGFFRSLFEPKSKGCSCGLQIEEVPVNSNPDKEAAEEQKEDIECNNSPTTEQS